MSTPAEAARYHRLQLVLSLAGFALGVVYLLAILGTGAAAALASAAADGDRRVVGPGRPRRGRRSAPDSRSWRFPLRWVRGFWLPRRFGLLHQSLASWLTDRAKAAALGAVLGLGGVLVIYGLLGATRWWWLIAAAVFFVVGIALAALFPILIVPLFYRLTPLADPELTATLLALARRAGVAVVGVWVVDESRKSRTANAAVVGLGRTRRIILYDTLATSFRREEVEAVLAHELGHHVHGDLRRGLLVQGALTLVTFWLAGRFMDAGVGLLGTGGAGRSGRAAVAGPGAARHRRAAAAAVQRLLALDRATGGRFRPDPHRQPGGLHRRHGAAGRAEPRRA